MNMAKKAKSKTKRPQQAASGTSKAEQNVPVSRQTAGGVTGAVLGAAVAGPLGAIAGGLTGALVGDASAKGKKPVRRAVDAIGTEIREAHLTDKLKAMGQRVTSKIQSLRKGKKTKKVATKKKSAPLAVATTKKSKSKPAKKKAKAATKKASAPKKKRAKKKS
jgi:hypothetical protein